MVVALALLAVITVATTVFFLRLIMSSTKGADQTVALELADSVLNQSADLPPGDWAALHDEHSAVLQSHGEEAPTVYTYRLDVNEVEGARAWATPAPPDDHVMGGLYRLDVEVTWWDTGHKQLGRLRAHASRVVFVERLKVMSSGT